MTANGYNPPSATRSQHEDYNDSSSTSFSSDSDTSMDWETTPPNSPVDATYKTPLTEASSPIGKSIGKMSLDFIAPGGRSRSFSSTNAQSLPSPVPSSPGSPSPSNRSSLELNMHARRATLQFTLPSLEKFPPVDLTTARSASWPTPNTIPPFIPPAPRSAPTPTTPRRTPLRLPRLDMDGRPIVVPPQPHIQHQHQQPQTPKRIDQREDRHPYDAEEKYAIIYLRVIKHLRWDDVLLRFHTLFPPGRPRRCTVSSSPFSGAGAAAAVAAANTTADSSDSSGPGGAASTAAAAAAAASVHSNLPPVYTRRNVQGLQCRWYRIRDEEGLVKLRGSWSMCVGAVGRKEKKVLEEMERAGVVGEKFLSMLRTREDKMV